VTAPAAHEAPIVGRITGYLDGEPVSGVFDGEVRNLAAVRPGGAA
jgi:hypothetical protein